MEVLGIPEVSKEGISSREVRQIAHARRADGGAQQHLRGSIRYLAAPLIRVLSTPVVPTAVAVRVFITGLSNLFGDMTVDHGLRTKKTPDNRRPMVEVIL